MTLLRILLLAFCTLLVYALYLPSAHPPERFLQQLRKEHQQNVFFWGEDDAQRILERSLSLYAGRDRLTPAAFVSTPGLALTDANAAVARQMSEVVQRMLHNRYAQGFDALVLLATYRLSALWQWLPWLAGFVVIACFDGYLVRVIRSTQFFQPSPTRFALCAMGATLVLALTLLLLIVPLYVDPIVLACMLLMIGLFIAGAIRHFRP